MVVCQVAQMVLNVLMCAGAVPLRASDEQSTEYVQFLEQLVGELSTVFAQWVHQNPPAAASPGNNFSPATHHHNDDNMYSYQNQGHCVSRGTLSFFVVVCVCVCKVLANTILHQSSVILKFSYPH